MRSNEPVTRAVCPTVTRVLDDQTRCSDSSSLTTWFPTGTSGRLSGVVPTAFPSIRTRAPRGRESTKILPVKPPGGADCVGVGVGVGVGGLVTVRVAGCRCNLTDKVSIGSPADNRKSCSAVT